MILKIFIRQQFHLLTNFFCCYWCCRCCLQLGRNVFFPFIFLDANGKKILVLWSGQTRVEKKIAEGLFPEWKKKEWRTERNEHDSIHQSYVFSAIVMYHQFTRRGENDVDARVTELKNYMKSTQQTEICLPGAGCTVCVHFFHLLCFFILPNHNRSVLNSCAPKKICFFYNRKHKYV